jgi:pectate lyase
MRPAGTTYLPAALALAIGSALAGAGEPADAVRAFPGAEGFGAVASGGRGGRVIKVTNLGTKGPGSLQAACQAKGPRIVVFDVSGVIRGHVTITEGDLTLAGQTAPGDGITIEGMLRTKYRVQPPVRNVIVRFLRVRPRPVKPPSEQGDCLQITHTDRLIVDHVSCSWGSDENVDLCGSSNVTVQWCAIEESDTVGHTKGRHNFGMIVGYTGTGGVTIHHNLFAHHSRRAPLIGCDVVDHRNNVIYNFLLPFTMHPASMNRRAPGEPFRVNLVANYFKDGPDVRAQMKGRPLDKLFHNRSCVALHAQGNVCTWLVGAADSTAQPLAEKPWPAPPVRTHSAREACELVLAQAGCLPRDAVSRRMVQEVRAGTGRWGRHEPEGGLKDPELPPGAPKDSDGDGLPDAWERAHRLDGDDPRDALKTVPPGASRDDRHRGYTWIEFYINELADRKVAAAPASPGSPSR